MGAEEICKDRGYVDQERTIILVPFSLKKGRLRADIIIFKTIGGFDRLHAQRIFLRKE